MKNAISLLALAAALAPATANAWFFFFIPGNVTSAISDKLTGAEGDNCVGPYAKVGDKIAVPGRGPGTIKSLSGTSMRCTTAEYPIRALIDFTALVPTALPSLPVTPASPDRSFELYQCVYATSKVGDGHYDSAAGSGVITAVPQPSAACPAGTPYRATVRFTGTAPTLVKEQPTTEINPALGPSRDAPDTGQAPTPAASIRTSADGASKASSNSARGFAHGGDPLGATPPAQPVDPASVESGREGVTAKLRNLQGMLREGLITQEDYDAKKGELLKQF